MQGGAPQYLVNITVISLICPIICLKYAEISTFGANISLFQGILSFFGVFLSGCEHFFLPVLGFLFQENICLICRGSAPTTPVLFVNKIQITTQQGVGKVFLPKCKICALVKGDLSLFLGSIFLWVVFLYLSESYIGVAPQTPQSYCE